MSCSSRSVGAVLGALAWLGLFAAPTGAVPVTLAPGLEAAYGDSVQGSELLRGRYQQVYSGLDFGFREALAITALSLRPFGTGPFSLSASAVEISLSTSRAAAPALSPVFAENLGLDRTVVYSGPLVLASGGRTGEPSADFDVALPMDRAFGYDPLDGDLLLELRLLGTLGNASGSVLLDARHPSALSPVASLFSLDANADSGNVFPMGLVTQFEVEALIVPEPATGLLFATGAFVLGLSARRGAAARRGEARATKRAVSERPRTSA